MRFNTSTATVNRTTNRAGGEAFRESPQLALVSLLLTSFVSDQSYRSADEALDELRSLIDANSDKRFVAKAAIYARTQFGMRSISHAVAGELANRVKGEAWTKSFFDRVIYRPDDMTEILSYYMRRYGKPIPNSLKKGFSQAITRFDAYKLAKYRGEGAAMSLVDVVNLVHPQNTEAIMQLVNGTLRSTDTWESELTRAGQRATTDEEKGQLKADVWYRLIRERKIGYFALLRNLRNILEQAPGVRDEALALLTDETLIRKSLVLPFRFSTAYQEIQKTDLDGAREVLAAISKAIDIATANVPRLEGKTLVVVDESGSMSGKPSEIASLFAAVIVKSNDADLMMFDDDARYHVVNPLDSTLTISNSFNFRSGGTNFHSIFETASKAYDRIIILSDMQGWGGWTAPTASLAAYKQRTGAEPRIYSFDLQGYGSLQFPEHNVYALAGFSEKVFDVMKLLEQDRNALVRTIEEVDL